MVYTTKHRKINKLHRAFFFLIHSEQTFTKENENTVKSNNGLFQS